MTILFSIITAIVLGAMALWGTQDIERDVEHAGETQTLVVPARVGDYVMRAVLAILAVTSLTLPALHGGWVLGIVVAIAGVVVIIQGQGNVDAESRLDDMEKAWRAEVDARQDAELQRASEALQAEARAHAEAMRQEQKADPAYRRAEAEARLRGLIAGGGTAGEEDAL